MPVFFNKKKSNRHETGVFWRNKSKKVQKKDIDSIVYSWFWTFSVKNTPLSCLFKKKIKWAWERYVFGVQTKTSIVYCISNFWHFSLKTNCSHAGSFHKEIRMGMRTLCFWRYKSNKSTIRKWLITGCPKCFMFFFASFGPEAAERV